MANLEQLLLAEDSRAIQVAQAGGEAERAVLARLAEHADGGVRLLVVECYAALADGSALLGRVDDRSEDVRLEAVNALLSLDPVALDQVEVVAAFDRARGFVRRQLALVLGRMPNSASRLGTRLHESDLASEGLLAALAKQGDVAARQRLARLMAEAEGDHLVELLRLFRYVGRADYSLDLLPVIEREDVAQNLSSHRRVIARRACDLGIEAFLELRPDELPWGFRPPHEPYTYTELVEIRQKLRAEGEAESE